MGVAPDGDAELATEAQIRDLEALLLGVHQQVLRLQIAVHNAVLVAVRHPLDQLVHEGLRGRGESSLALKQVQSSLSSVNPANVRSAVT